MRQVWKPALRGENALRFRNEENSTPDELTIVALGDSITNAAGLADVQEEHTYRHLVQEALTREMGRTVRVINAGVNGDITPLAVRRLDRDVVAHKPDCVTIMFGVNDAGFFRPDGPVADTPRTPLPEFEAHLRAIVRRVREVGALPVLATPVPMSPSYWLANLPQYVKNGLNYLVDQYADVVRKVASDERVPLVDPHRRFSADPSTHAFVPDGIHPDRRGQKLLAELFVPVLTSALRNAPRAR